MDPLQRGVYHHTSAKSGFRIASIESPRNQKEHHDQKERATECTLSFLCNLFGVQDTYEKNKSAFSSHAYCIQIRVLAIELTILDNLLFSRNLDGVNAGLLHFKSK